MTFFRNEEDSIFNAFNMSSKFTDWGLGLFTKRADWLIMQLCSSTILEICQHLNMRTNEVKTLPILPLTRIFYWIDLWENRLLFIFTTNSFIFWCCCCRRCCCSYWCQSCCLCFFCCFCCPCLHHHYIVNIWHLKKVWWLRFPLRNEVWINKQTHWQTDIATDGLKPEFPFLLSYLKNIYIQTIHDFFLSIFHKCT